VAISLRIEPEDQAVDPGHEVFFTVHVMNQSGVVDRVALEILGPASAWSRTEPPAVSLFPGADAVATVAITPPLQTPFGHVAIGVRGTAETSGHVDVGEATLNVGASRAIEGELRPRSATGKRRATSVVVLHNLGNAPADVQITATDPDDAIVFDAPGAAVIDPGTTAELPLRMRLPTRERQGASLPYQVLIGGGGGEQTLDGQVRQPPRRRWPVLAALLALGLAAVAVAALRPEDSVALKNAGSDQAITSTLAGATTTELGATTAVTAAPTEAAGPGGPGSTVTGDVAPGGSTPGPGPGPNSVVPNQPRVTDPPPPPVTPTTRPGSTTSAPPPAGTQVVGKNSSKIVVDTRMASEPGGSPVVIASFSDPPHGTAIIGDSNQTLTYRPDPNYVGGDELTYTVKDGHGGTATAKLLISVR